MKYQFIILFLCTLISHSLTHEHPAKAHNKANYPHSHARHLPHNRHHPQKRDNTNSTGLDVYYCHDTFIAFHNTTSQIAAIFDYNSAQLLLVNFIKGKGIGLDINTRSVVELDAEKDPNFYTTITSLKPILSKGHAPQDQNVTTQIINRAGSQLGIDDPVPIKTLIEATAVLSQLRNTTLAVLLKGKSNFTLKAGGITRVLSIVRGVTDLLDDLKGPPGNVTLDFNAIATSRNGVAALIKILQVLAPKIDLSKLTTLNSLPGLLKIITELGGNDTSSSGADNVIRLIYSIVLVTQGQASPDVLIQVLIQISDGGGVDVDGEEWKSLLDELLKLAESQPGQGEALKPLIKLLEDLNKNNVFLSGVNVNEVIELLKRGDYKSATDKIVAVLIYLGKSVNPAQTIPRFFGYIITIVSSPSSWLKHPNLVPGLDPSSLQNTNVTQLLQGSNGTNLSQVPGIGPIYNILAGCVKNATNGSLGLDGLLSNSSGWSTVLNSVSQNTVFFGFFKNFEQTISVLLGGLNWIPHPPAGLLPPGIGSIPFLGPLLQGLSNGSTSATGSPLGSLGLGPGPVIFPTETPAADSSTPTSTSASNSEDTTPTSTSPVSDEPTSLSDRSKLKNRHHARKEFKHHREQNRHQLAEKENHHDRQ